MLNYLLLNSVKNIVRNIYWRGLSNNIWVCGQLSECEHGTFLRQLDGTMIPVKKETVSEYIGLRDHTKWDELPEHEQISIVAEVNKNANKTMSLDDFSKVWEGIPIHTNDIVSVTSNHNPENSWTGIVCFINACYGVATNTEDPTTFVSFNDLLEFTYKIIGNVFEQ